MIHVYSEYSETEKDRIIYKKDTTILVLVAVIAVLECAVIALVAKIMYT